MPFKLYMENIFTVFVLVCTFLALAATSYSQSYMDDDIYRLSSDCTNPTTDQVTITVEEGVVTEPVGVSFIDFGFPIADLSDRDHITGTVGSVQRQCDLTYGGFLNSFETFVYTCEDDDQYSCVIILERD